MSKQDQIGEQVAITISNTRAGNTSIGIISKGESARRNSGTSGKVSVQLGRQHGGQRDGLSSGRRRRVSSSSKVLIASSIGRGNVGAIRTSASSTARGSSKQMVTRVQTVDEDAAEGAKVACRRLSGERQEGGVVARQAVDCCFVVGCI